jgi:hypothetical protein
MKVAHASAKELHDNAKGELRMSKLTLDAKKSDSNL